MKTHEQVLEMLEKTEKALDEMEETLENSCGISPPEILEAVTQEYLILYTRYNTLLEVLEDCTQGG